MYWHHNSSSSKLYLSLLRITQSRPLLVPYEALFNVDLAAKESRLLANNKWIKYISRLSSIQNQIHIMKTFNWREKREKKRIFWNKENFFGFANCESDVEWNAHTEISALVVAQYECAMTKVTVQWVFEWAVNFQTRPSYHIFRRHKLLICAAWTNVLLLFLV